MAVGVGRPDRSADWSRPGRDFRCTRIDAHAGGDFVVLDVRGPRNKVVMVELEFPSIHISTRATAARWRRVRGRSGSGPHCATNSTWISCSQPSTKRPCWWADSQVFSGARASSTRAPLFERAHRVGAHVDTGMVFQATGTIPLAYAALGVDFCRRWCPSSARAAGRRGVSLCPEICAGQVRPALTGWSAQPRPFAFETGAIDPCERLLAVFETGRRTFRALLRPAGAGNSQQSWHRGGTREILRHEPAAS